MNSISKAAEPLFTTEKKERFPSLIDIDKTKKNLKGNLEVS